MSEATLNVRLSPRRMLPPREAAGYCGLSEKKFIAVCKVQPVELPGGDRRYDIRDLDTWIDSLKTGEPNDDEDIIGRLGK